MTATGSRGSPDPAAESRRHLEFSASRRLLKQIMVPAMILTWTFGILLVLTPGVVDWSGFNWWHVKFAAVLAMTGFQGAVGKWRREFAEDRNQRPHRFYRLANEVPTVLLVLIVVMAIVKPL